MSDDQHASAPLDVNVAFLKTRRGILKVAEMVVLFAAFACALAAMRSTDIVATTLEFIITALLLLLYLLRLNKRITFFFWPLVDAFNSVFAAVYFIILSTIALRTFLFTSTLVGGIFGYMLTMLLCVDSYTVFRSITLNQPVSQSQSTENR